MTAQPPNTRMVPTIEFLRQINVVLNWFEELKQKVPVKQ